MNLSRRGFFGLLGASGATAVVAASAEAQTPMAVSLTEALPAAQGKYYQDKYNEHLQWHIPLAPAPERRVIERAMRLLGILRAGESASHVDYQAAQVALNQMLHQWYAEQRPYPTEREVTYGLAAELGPEYGLLASKEGTRFYRDAMTMVWPAVGK